MQRAMITAFMVMGLVLGTAWGTVWGQTPAAGYILTEHHFLWGDQIWGTRRDVGEGQGGRAQTGRQS